MTRQTRPTWDQLDAQRRDRAAKAPGVPRDVSVCKSPRCSATIRWGVTVDGERMPVDAAPDPDGNLVRVMVAAGDWRIRVLAPGEVPDPYTHRWTSHYATCPDANRFRRRGHPRAVPDPERAAVASLAPLGPTTVATAGPPAAGTLLAVDGNSLAHRAFHAYERTGMTTPDGAPIWAVYGFLSLLAGICDRIKPDALVVGFDDRAASARRDQYPQYKAGRAEKSPDVYPQIDAIADTLQALDVQVIVPAGWEADDVLGSAATAAEAAGWQCVIATSDKDAFALISESTSVLRLVSGLDNAVRMTPQTLVDQYGVAPAQYGDYSALCGDTSDALPGVQGIGPKTAAKLLAAVGSVDTALADPAATAAAIGKAAAGKLGTDEARTALDRNRAIMAIRRDLPVDVNACRLAVRPATVASVLEARHLPSLVSRVATALTPPPPASSTSSASSAPPLAAVPALPEPPPPVAPVEPAPPLVRADPPPACPGCGQEAAAALPLAQLDASRPVLTGREVLVDQAHPAGDLIAVQVGDVWAVRYVQPGEHNLPPRNRRRAHYCQQYPHRCLNCGDPARLYLGGPFCDRDRPSAYRPEPRTMS